MSIMSRDEIAFGHRCSFCQFEPTLEDNRQWVAHPGGLQHPFHIDCYDLIIRNGQPCPNCRVPLIAREHFSNLTESQSFSLSSLSISVANYFPIKTISRAAGLSLAAYSFFTDQRGKGLGSVFGHSIYGLFGILGTYLGVSFAYLINGNEESYNYTAIRDVLYSAGVVSSVAYLDVKKLIYISSVLAAIAQFTFNNLPKNKSDSINRSILNKLRPFDEFISEIGRTYMISVLFSMVLYPPEEAFEILSKLIKQTE